MTEITDFGLIVLVVAGASVLAVGANKLTERFPVPAPVLFLVTAAFASDAFPGLAALSIKDVERIGVVALAFILFDGGMHVGWRRFRASALPIAGLGLLGTFATAGVLAALAHSLFDFSWTIAGVLGAALAPTDPAVMFSVLGKREIGGRTGTILEGESGANDPVGIALMIGMIELATHEDATFWVVVREFAIEMSVGLAIGVAAPALLLPLVRRIALPLHSLYPILTLAAAGVIYGVTAVAHGSGFLAVFITGLLIGDARAPHKQEIERFHTSLANLAEIVAFVALGLTIDITDLDFERVWVDGILLALILAFVVRPIVAGALVIPARLRWGERVFVMWSGLKGAVPILLAAFAILEQVPQAERIYGIVFVVVAFSVLVQGTSVPFVAPRLGVPMRVAEPKGMITFVVARGSHAEGRRVRDLPLGERSWIDLVERAGRKQATRGSSLLAAGDAVTVITEVDDVESLGRLFGER